MVCTTFPTKALYQDQIALFRRMFSLWLFQYGSLYEISYLQARWGTLVTELGYEYPKQTAQIQPRVVTFIEKAKCLKKSMIFNDTR